MELNPRTITSVEFQLVRKGYDPEEVRSFLTSLAKGVEAMQTQLANADARARAAVQRMQEVSSQAASPASAGVAADGAAAGAPLAATAETIAQSETIARTLVLAQVTADRTVSEAEDRSRSMISTAEDRSRGIVEEAEGRSAQIVRAAEDRSAQMIERAKADAVQAHAGEVARMEAEVAVLMGRRDELHQVLDVLGTHVADQRSRLSNAADVLRALLEEPQGLHQVAVPPELEGDALLGAPAVPPAPTMPAPRAEGALPGVATESSAGEAPVQANEPLVVDSSRLVEPLPGLDAGSEVPTFNDVRWASDDD